LQRLLSGGRLPIDGGRPIIFPACPAIDKVLERQIAQRRLSLRQAYRKKGMVLGFVIASIWLFLPVFLIAKSRHTSGLKKIYWAVGALLPLVLTVSITKVIQRFEPTSAWASEDLFTTISSLLLVMVFLVGGWAVLLLHDSIYDKQA
jgi:hypothetical protein